MGGRDSTRPPFFCCFSPANPQSVIIRHQALRVKQPDQLGGEIVGEIGVGTNLVYCPMCGESGELTEDRCCRTCGHQFQTLPETRPTPARRPSVLRGCAFAVLYATASWIVVGIIVSLSVAALFPRNPAGVAAAISVLALFFIALPLGIYGFFRHRRGERGGNPFSLSA